jgi:hypothetical protein
MSLYCPNCKAEVKAEAANCGRCAASFTGVGGWRPVAEIVPAKSRPNYAAWFIFSPFPIIVLSVPLFQWVAFFIAPVLIVVCWFAIFLHAWFSSRGLPADERALLRLGVGLGLVAGCGLILYWCYPYFKNLVAS